MDKASYNRLLHSQSDEDEASETGLVNYNRRHLTQPSRSTRFLSIANITIPWLISALLACVVVYDRIPGWERFRQHTLYPSQKTYSPAQDVLEYKLVTYHTNINEAPVEFQGPPSAELDKAWDDLYNFGISTRPKEQAKLLPNYTSPVPGHEDAYIVELDVFHQLHCLNIFRKAFTPIYLSDWPYISDQSLSANNWSLPAQYPYDQLEENRIKHHINPWHIGHCLESLRQSIMCHSDITPEVWHWDEKNPEAKKNKPWMTVPHTCRDFQRIKEWAEQRVIQWDFDYFSRIPVQFDIPTYP